MITREAMMLVENSLTFTKQVTRKYDDRFAQSGGKIGDTLSLRLPPQYTVTDGPNLSTQDFKETSASLVINKQKHIDVTFTSKELTLSIQDFSDRVLAPQVVQLANQIDQDGLALFSSVYNSVGTPGSANTTLAPYLSAGVALDNGSVPRDISKRNVVLHPQGQADIVGGSVSTYFNDQDSIGKQYVNGTMGRAVGFKFSMDQNVNALTVGPMGGTPVVDGASQTGATLAMKSWTAAAASRLLGGETFTIAGVYSVNPLSKVSTGKLQSFTAVGAWSSDAAGKIAAVAISPSIIITGATQNVTASPADAAAITWTGGAASAVTPVSLAFHEQAFVLGCVDLEDVSKYGAWGSRLSDSQLGISMRIARQYAISTDTIPCRIDILYGWLCPRPQFACRIYGSNS